MEPAPDQDTTANRLDDAVDVPIETPADDAAEQALPASTDDDADGDEAADTIGTVASRSTRRTPPSKRAASGWTTTTGEVGRDDRRHFLRLDWSLRSCGRHGHATYAPDEPELRERLRAETPIGTAWRCLRCGDFVVGEPRGHGPAADAPEVIRGRALRDLVILRLLAVERLVRGLLVLLVAYGVFRFRSRQGSIEQAFNEDLPLIQKLADKFHWNFEDSAVVRAIHTFLTFKQSTLGILALGLAIYGLLQLVEATGLWLAKRWGEYFAVVATAAFIPIEVYELVERVTWLRDRRTADQHRCGRLSAPDQAAVRAARRQGGVRGGAARGEPARGAGGGSAA